MKLSRQKLEIFLQQQASNAKTLDVGGTGTGLRGFFPNRVSLNINPETKPDIVADGHDMHMVKDNSYDIVLCLNTLEHCENPQKVLLEIHRVLKPNGKLIMSTPFMTPIHTYPQDYWRFTDTALRKMLSDAGFGKISITTDMTTSESLSFLIDRVIFQTKAPWKPLKIYWKFLSFLLRHTEWLITRNYGDVSKKSNLDHSFMPYAFYTIAYKTD